MTELASLAKPVIIVPMPHSHQETNAIFFAEKNAAIVVRQGDSTGLKVAVESLRSVAVLGRTLANNLHQLLNPQAAAAYVQVIKEHIALEVEAHPFVYLAGIGGIGLSALAEYFTLMHYTVRGLDLAKSA